MCPIPPKYWKLVNELKEVVFRGEDIEINHSGLKIVHNTLDPVEYLSGELSEISARMLKKEGYQGIIVLFPWVCKKRGKDYSFVKDVVKSIIDTSIDVTGLCLNQVFDNWKGEPIDDERIHLLCLYEK